MFPGSSLEWNKNQIILTAWLKQYAQVEELDNPPSEDIVDSDYEFDRWIQTYINEIEDKKRERENAQRLMGNDHQQI